jgi:hypothetical protein
MTAATLTPLPTSDQPLPPITLIAETAAELARAAQLAEDWTAMRALNKAAFHVGAGLRPVFSSGDLLIPSGTRAGVIHRMSQAGCDCEAGRSGTVCWHAALAEIITAAYERIAQMDQAIPLPEPIDHARVLAEIDELYA